MFTQNPNFDRPYKNYIRFDIFGAGVAVVATLARMRKVVTITWQETVKPMTETQTAEYVKAMLRCIGWGSANSGLPTGWANRPGKQVETDGQTFSKRLLFHDDDSAFVEVRRTPLGFGLYTKPKVTIDGGSGDMETTNQAVNSIYAALADAKGWGK